MAGTNNSHADVSKDSPLATSAQDPVDKHLAQQHQNLTLAVRSLNREDALTIAGHPHPVASMIGDVAGLSAVILPSTLKIEARDVPWLHAGSGRQCSGAKNLQMQQTDCHGSVLHAT